ncbi:hypothetical protein C0Q44_26220 [Paenibacillus sp. PCH8]|nr:hypothetical protein C0Q44_26220 [Paenibacillus sp. PCH8]
MSTWNELEKQFKELAPSFQFSRLDIQWGDSGEHFRIAGTTDRLSVERFEILAQIAGSKLNNSVYSQEYPEIMDETNALFRWYKALWKIGNNLEFGFMGNMMNDEEEVIGNIYTGTIQHFIKASEVLCFRLSSLESISVQEIPRERPPHSLNTLHPRIVRISKALYMDGHFRGQY